MRSPSGVTRMGVGRRAAGHFGRGPHIPVDRGGAGFVDQRHAAFGHAMQAKKALVGLHQHIENCIANRENVVFRFCHPLVLLSVIALVRKIRSKAVVRA